MILFTNRTVIGAVTPGTPGAPVGCSGHLHCNLTTQHDRRPGVPCDGPASWRTFWDTNTRRTGDSFGFSFQVFNKFFVAKLLQLEFAHRILPRSTIWKPLTVACQAPLHGTLKTLPQPVFDLGTVTPTSGGAPAAQMVNCTQELSVKTCQVIQVRNWDAQKIISFLFA